MRNWHADVEQDILSSGVLEDEHETFPGVEIRVTLEEVVKATITSDLKL